MPRPPTCAELDKQAALHAQRLDVVEVSADKTATTLEKTRLEYEGEIRALKEQVGELKADKKSREGHDGDIKTLKEQVVDLRSEVKYWRNFVVGLGTATVLLLLRLQFK